MKCRNITNDVKTGIISRSRDKPEVNLITALAASGTEAA